METVQHHSLHNYMNEISKWLDGYAENIQSEVRRLHRNLSDYIETLRCHINAENGIFYPLLAKMLTEDEMQWLAKEFEKYAAVTTTLHCEGYAVAAHSVPEPRVGRTPSASGRQQDEDSSPGGPQ